MPFPAYRFPGLLQPEALPRIQGGLLDGRVFGYNMPGAGLLQPAADILQFRRRQGLLGLEGEGAARPGGGPRIGSPEWTRAYEAQSGLRPGTLQPIERGVAPGPGSSQRFFKGTALDPNFRPGSFSDQLRAAEKISPASGREGTVGGTFSSAKQQGQLERNKASAELNKLIEKVFEGIPTWKGKPSPPSVAPSRHAEAYKAALRTQKSEQYEAMSPEGKRAYLLRTLAPYFSAPPK